MFDVGGGLLPAGKRPRRPNFFEYWHSDQNTNWIGNSKGSAALNQDKNLTTSWYSVGGQYMFNREWGIMGRVPCVNRSFTTTADPTTGALATYNARDWGDMEIMGTYTGFFKDMSTGVIFGLKLPTGNYTAYGFDRDTQIGSGSTDLILGGFHRGMISGDNAWQYFGQIRYQQPFLYRSSYDTDAGAGRSTSPATRSTARSASSTTTGTMFSASTRSRRWRRSSRRTARATRAAADPLNSGFDRLMFSPASSSPRCSTRPTTGS